MGGFGKHAGILNGFYGKHHTEDTKKIMSQKAKLRVGVLNSFYGKHHSEETKQRIREKLLGRKRPEEVKEKLSLAFRGQKNPFYGKHHSKATLARISSINTKSGLYEMHRKRMKEKNPMKDPLIARKVAQTNKQNGVYRRQSLRMKEKNPMKNPESLSKMLKTSFKERPNNSERKLLKIINQNHLPFVYVGDGSYIVNGKCPDFVHINGRKKVIELFGDYWHKGDDPEKRIQIFREFGFDCLVLWEHELKNPAQVVESINNFIGG